MADIVYKSWGERLVDSIKGVLIGIVLFIISFPLLFWNEWRAVDTATALEAGKGAVVEADVKTLDPAKDGKEVHVTGEATTQETLSDPVFDISLNALRLSRSVEMYQWKEDVKTETKKKLGGGEEEVKTYTYSKEWSSGYNDSSKFDTPQGHTNPPKPYDNEVWRARQVKLGAFDLPERLADEIGGDEKLPVTSSAENKFPPGTQVMADGRLYLGKNPTSPEVGDMRVEFKVVKPPRTVSVLARQGGKTFEPYQVKGATFTIYRLMDGQKAADEMFKQMEGENTMLTWILRLVGFILMAVGIFLVINPLVTVADVVPFIGNLLGAGAAIFALLLALPLSLATIGVGWVFYRPLIGVPLLIGAVALLVGGIWLLRRRSPAALDKKA
jgi:hypothetical protein